MLRQTSHPLIALRFEQAPAGCALSSDAFTLRNRFRGILYGGREIGSGDFGGLHSIRGGFSLRKSHPSFFSSRRPLGLIVALRPPYRDAPSNLPSSHRFALRASTRRVRTLFGCLYASKQVSKRFIRGTRDWERQVRRIMNYLRRLYDHSRFFCIGSGIHNQSALRQVRRCIVKVHKQFFYCEYRLTYYRIMIY